MLKVKVVVAMSMATGRSHCRDVGNSADSEQTSPMGSHPSIKDTPGLDAH
jgi:hypothetical protein